MKFDELEIGMLVEDRWFPRYGIGKVKTILQTIVKIEFSQKGEITFDKSHCQFLEKLGYKNKQFGNKKKL